MNRNRSDRGTVLILTLPERSAVNAILALSRRLVESGRRVVYFGSPKLERYIARQGFVCEVFDFYGEIRFADDLARLSRLGRLRRAGPETRLWSEIYRNVLCRIREWLSANWPDVVLLDQLMWPYALPFMEIGVPIIGLSATLASVRNRFAPPVFSDIIPGARTDGCSDVRNLLAWARLDASFWLARVRQNLLFCTNRDRWGWRDLDPEKLIGRHGFRLRRGEYGLRLEVPELVLAPSELDFPCAMQANPRCYAGACVDQRRKDVAFPWQRIDPRKVLIYCSLGTYSHRYQHAHRLFHAAIEVSRRHPEWQMILQVGGTRADEAFRALPENVVMAAEVPQLEFLARAAISVTHGGLSSIRESIFYGVPMLVFPCWYDQPGNAARVSFYRLGLRGDIRRVNASQLSDMIRHLFADESYGHAVKRMQRIFRQQEDCQPGVDLIEGYLPRCSTPSSLEQGL